MAAAGAVGAWGERSKAFPCLSLSALSQHVYRIGTSEPAMNLGAIATLICCVISGKSLNFSEPFSGKGTRISDVFQCW